MAAVARLRPSLLPQCPACAQRFLRLGLGAPAPQQTRGKKKLAKGQTNTITVKLLQDVTSFGPQGTFVPISSGQMRNDWFPKGIADYVPHLELRQLTKLANKPSFERIHTYMTDADRAQQGLAVGTAPAPEPEAEPARAAIKLEQLSPQRAAELVEIFVPPRIDFHRQAIEAEPGQAPEEQQAQRSVSPAAAIMAAAAAATRVKRAPPRGIYGSVSTADIAARIVAALRENDEAARVVLSESNLRVVGLADDEDTTRLKHIGEFEVEIQLKGAEEPVKRVVRVLPLEGSAQP